MYSLKMFRLIEKETNCFSLKRKVYDLCCWPSLCVCAAMMYIHTTERMWKLRLKSGRRIYVVFWRYIELISKIKLWLNCLNDWLCGVRFAKCIHCTYGERIRPTRANALPIFHWYQPLVLHKYFVFSDVSRFWHLKWIELAFIIQLACHRYLLLMTCKTRTRRKNKKKTCWR